MSKTVLGGGLSGLSAAYYLSKKLPKEKIILIESSNRTGGWLKSNHQKNGIIFEQGPRTIRPRGPAAANTLNLIRDLNLSNEIVSIPSNHPVAQNRMIFAKNKLHLLPNSFLSALMKREPFSKPLVLFLLRDLTTASIKKEDESIYDFVYRRFGSEIAEYLISPLIRGICAGDAKQISVKFLMQPLFDYEQKYGSITKGVINNLKFGKKSVKSDNNLIERAKLEKWSVYSFKEGIETLPKALQNHINNNNVELKLNSKCKEIEFKKNLVILDVNDKKNETNSLISAIPADILGDLLVKQHPKLSILLKKIKRVSVGVVNLHFDKENLLQTEGFGFLVTPQEKIPILGVIYDSCSFPKKGSTVLTAMMGGFWFEEYFGHNPSEEFLLETALTQIKRILNIDEKPSQFKVNILHKCIPQYVVGHYENLTKIDDYIKCNGLPLVLCGASYRGVGMNEVILSARKAVENLK